MVGTRQVCRRTFGRLDADKKKNDSCHSYLLLIKLFAAVCAVRLRGAANLAAEKLSFSNGKLLQRERTLLINLLEEPKNLAT